MSDFEKGFTHVRAELYKTWQSGCNYAQVKANDFVKESTKILFPKATADIAKSHETLKNYRAKAGIVAFVAGAAFLNSIVTRVTPVFSTLACYVAYNAITVLNNAEGVVKVLDKELVEEVSFNQQLKKNTFLADWATEFFAAGVAKEREEEIAEEKRQADSSTLVGMLESTVTSSATIVLNAGKDLLGIMTPADKMARDVKYLRYAQAALVVLITDAASRVFRFKSLSTIAYGAAASLFFYNIYQIAQNAKDVVVKPKDYIKTVDADHVAVDSDKVTKQMKINTVYFGHPIETFAPTIAEKYLFPSAQ